MNDRGGFRQIIASRDDEIIFGKHKGKSIYWVLEHEPSYILWASDEKIMQVPQEILDDAEDYELEMLEDDEWMDYENFYGVDPYDFMDD